jgi:hypothetical protein
MEPERPGRKAVRSDGVADRTPVAFTRNEKGCQATILPIHRPPPETGETGDSKTFTSQRLGPEPR